MGGWAWRRPRARAVTPQATYTHDTVAGLEAAGAIGTNALDGTRHLEPQDGGGAGRGPFLAAASVA